MAQDRIAFVGIDVAFAKGKRLPLAVCVLVGGRLTSLPLRRSFPPPPKGAGNRGAIDSKATSAFARDALEWLAALERGRGLQITTVALDAPSSPRSDSRSRRLAEEALDQAGISCIATPSWCEFKAKIREAQKHLDNGGSLASLPSANQFWMLAGFDLHRQLRARYKCIEVYPQAIVHGLNCTDEPKTTKAGYDSQLNAVARELGYRPSELDSQLQRMGFGARHDRLDAFMSAWVASLPEGERTWYGVPPDDCIWTPRPRAQAPPPAGR